jgi:hypothetical protein
MEQKPGREKYEPKEKVPVFRDIWQFIIKVILALLVVAWFVTEFMQDRKLYPIKLIILLIVLCVIIWLILKQKHFVCLKCSLTDPGECVHGDTSILSGKLLEPVLGDAYGWGFSHYILELRSPNGTLLSDVMIYPDNGGNPDTTLTQGNYTVTNGTLGWIDLEKAATDAGFQLLTSTTFEITLRVFDVYGGEKSTPCQITFDVSVKEVYIKRVSVPWSVNYIDPDEPLRTANDASADLATIGGWMHVRGAANIYGCLGEKIREYTIWVIPDPTFSFAQPAALTPVAPGADWVTVSHVEYTSQTINSDFYTADQLRTSNILDGDPLPDILTNSGTWETRLECITIGFNLQLCIKVPTLIPDRFYSKSVCGTGKFTFLLQVINTAGHQYYDIQRAWIDNEKEVAEVTAIDKDGVELPACEDLYMKNTVGEFRSVDIKGTAWDALIDPADPTIPTSDNFDRYVLKFQKQGAAGWEEIVTSNSPVPARPNPVGVGTLANWDLETLDAASNPNEYPADQLLIEGEYCTYTLKLWVYDRTIVNEHAPDIHHEWDVFPIKIINSPEPTP